MLFKLDSALSRLLAILPTVSLLVQQLVLAQEAGEVTTVTVSANAFDARTDDSGCTPSGCTPANTRDGDLTDISRWSCSAELVEAAGGAVGEECQVVYEFAEAQSVASVSVAFLKGDERTRTLAINVNGELFEVIESGGTTSGLETFDLGAGAGAPGVLALGLESVGLAADEFLSVIEVEFEVSDSVISPPSGTTSAPAPAATTDAPVASIPVPDTVAPAAATLPTSAPVAATASPVATVPVPATVAPAAATPPTSAPVAAPATPVATVPVPATVAPVAAAPLTPAPAATTATPVATDPLPRTTVPAAATPPTPAPAATTDAPVATISLPDTVAPVRATPTTPGPSATTDAPVATIALPGTVAPATVPTPAFDATSSSGLSTSARDLDVSPSPVTPTSVPFSGVSFGSEDERSTGVTSYGWNGDPCLACYYDDVCAECITGADDREADYTACVEGSTANDVCDVVFAAFCCAAALSGNDCMANEPFVDFVGCVVEEEEQCSFDETTCGNAVGFGGSSSGPPAAPAAGWWRAILTCTLGLVGVVAVMR